MFSSTASFASSMTTLWLGVLFLALASFANSANAHVLSTPIQHIPRAEFDLFPERNMTGGPAGEIECYALPYGGMGIFSHILTYWAMIWIAVGRRPLWPLHPMTTFYKFDMVLATFTVCTCIPLATVTMIRCRLSWQFILISMWKLLTSIALACITIHRCLIIRRSTKSKATPQPVSLRNIGQNVQQARLTVWEKLSRTWLNPNHPQPQDTHFHWFHREPQTTPHDRSPLWWLILHLVGCIVGMTGLISLVATTLSTDASVRKLTGSFIAVIVVVPLCVAIYWYAEHLGLARGGWRVLVSAYMSIWVGSTLAFWCAFGGFSTLYADLVLGAVSENWQGLPSAEFAPLYWAWFAVMKVPLFYL